MRASELWGSHQFVFSCCLLCDVERSCCVCSFVQFSGGGFDAAICYKTPPNASFVSPITSQTISITHTSIPMKASTVVKLLLVAYIPLSAYFSATNVFEETTMDLDVSHSFFIKCILDSSRIEQNYLHQQQFGVHRYVE